MFKQIMNKSMSKEQLNSMQNIKEIKRLEKLLKILIKKEIKHNV